MIKKWLTERNIVSIVCNHRQRIIKKHNFRINEKEKEEKKEINNQNIAYKGIWIYYF